MKSQAWKTAISKVEPNKVVVRGYPVEQLIGNISYPATVYLLLKGELPDEKAAPMLDAILVSSVDHGVTPPSTQSAILSASTGAPLNAAMAAGILSINEFHGAAIEKCMVMLLSVMDLMQKEAVSLEKAAEKAVRDVIARKERVWGFGHRKHQADPRSGRLLELAEEHGFSGNYVQIGKSIVEVLQREKGKSLPLNVDGAIAAILCEMGISPEYANAFFIMSRIPGLVAHIVEEKQRYQPMRKIDFPAAEYDGPNERRLPHKDNR